jgi:hypothetical protein
MSELSPALEFVAFVLWNLDLPQPLAACGSSRFTPVYHVQLGTQVYNISLFLGSERPLIIQAPPDSPGYRAETNSHRWFILHMIHTCE